MKKTTLLLLAILFVGTPVLSQNSFDIGVNVGITNYFGDLGNEPYYQSQSTRPGVAITVRNFLNNPRSSGMHYRSFSIEGRLSWHRIGYDETRPLGDARGFQLKNYGRGLSFRTDLFGLAAHGTYTIYPNRYKPLYMQTSVMFLFAGIGVYYGEPKADLFKGDADINNRYHFWRDGTVRDAPEESGSGNIIEKDGEFETNLRDWHTEGQGTSSEGEFRSMYSPVFVGIPFGFGFRFGLSRNVTLSTEFGWYKFFSDFLDDASDRYATYQQIEEMYPNDPEMQAIAKYISDPTGKGTNGAPGPATSPRGNPAKTDSYSFINVEVAYRLKFRNWRPMAVF